MEFYTPQNIYRKLNNHHVRLGIIKMVKALRKRHLLVRVDTNDACNLKCVMCYFSDPNRKPSSGPMSLEMFNQLAEQVFPKTRYLYMSCGTEPFVTAHFDKLLDAMGQYKVPFVSYVTNGILMKDKFIEATLRNGVNEVIFSVDGGTKETYEKIRVGATWEKFNDRVAAFVAARDAWSGPVPEIRFNFTVQEGNKHELVTFLEWACQWKPRAVQLRLFRSLEGAVKQHDDEGSAQALRDAQPQLINIARKAGVHLELPREHHERRSNKTNNGESLNRVNCQLPWFNLFVTANGDVHPCTVHGPIGNFLKTSINNIQSGDSLSQLQQNLRGDPEDVCVHCQLTAASDV